MRYTRPTAIAACAVLSASATAWADSERETLTLEVAGQIAPACALEMQPNARVGELSRAGEAAIPFTIACNHTLAFTMRSQHGALRHQSHDQWRVPYVARVELSGSPQSAFRSEDMREGGSAGSFGDVVPFQHNGLLHISWSSPRETLAQGTYEDVLTITMVMDGQ